MSVIVQFAVLTLGIEVLEMLMRECWFGEDTAQLCEVGQRWLPQVVIEPTEDIVYRLIAERMKRRWLIRCDFCESVRRGRGAVIVVVTVKIVVVVVVEGR